MAYTTYQMAAHAELHYDSAQRKLQDGYAGDRTAALGCIAEALSGLLALSLARYADGSEV